VEASELVLLLAFSLVSGNLVEETAFGEAVLLVAGRDGLLLGVLVGAFRVLLGAPLGLGIGEARVREALGAPLAVFGKALVLPARSGLREGLTTTTVVALGSSGAGEVIGIAEASDKVELKAIIVFVTEALGLPVAVALVLGSAVGLRVGLFFGPL
jgi:hypothetical protein